eukprot:11208651-Lingulodinium_polyedra.AAC.1
MAAYATAIASGRAFRQVAHVLHCAVLGVLRHAGMRGTLRKAELPVPNFHQHACRQPNTSRGTSHTYAT